MKIEENIKKLIEGRLEADEVAFLDEAIKRLEKRDGYILKRHITNHPKLLERHLFFGTINKMIKQLTSLQKEGYESVSQESGYSNHFFANKKQLETDEEYVDRLTTYITKEIWAIEDESEEVVLTKEFLRKHGFEENIYWHNCWLETEKHRINIQFDIGGKVEYLHIDEIRVGSDNTQCDRQKLNLTNIKYVSELKKALQLFNIDIGL